MLNEYMFIGFVAVNYAVQCYLTLGVHRDLSLSWAIYMTGIFLGVWGGKMSRKVWP